MNDFATFEELPIDADRLCEGISRIGYKPSAALMDICDNSVAASAQNVRISLLLKQDASLTTRGGVLSYRIWDDGLGMSNDQIKTALMIGSQTKYPTNSLSKFGLGLKSAGFSLGDRIRVLSKHQGVLSRQWVLDRDAIRQAGRYGTYSEAPDAEFEALLANISSGTVLEIDKLENRQDSAGRTKSELVERLGVTYWHFLGRDENPLSIFLKVGQKEESIEPVDFLFTKDAASSFDPDTYDCKTPVKACDRMIENPNDPGGEKMRLEIVFFPQDKMKSFAGLSAEERNRIKSYRIGRGQDGFFLYRNGRMIVWGERIAGVTRNDINFRARLSFSSAHDELLHVDVSKQHLMIPEDLEETLRTLCRIPLGQARSASDLCSKLINEGVGVEGEEFNRRTEVFEEEDPDETSAPVSPDIKRKRREKLNEQSKEAEKQESGEPVGPVHGATENADTVEPSFERVRYSTAIIGSNVAVPGYDTDYETFVRINKNHPFYQLMLNAMPPADRHRQAIESLLFASAVAENKVLQNTSSIELDVLQAIFDKYRRTLSQNLESWLMMNQDIFG